MKHDKPIFKDLNEFVNPTRRQVKELIYRLNHCRNCGNELKTMAEYFSGKCITCQTDEKHEL